MSHIDVQPPADGEAEVRSPESGVCDPAPLDRAGIEELLSRLLGVLLDTCETVETTAILLQEKSTLRVCAAAALAPEAVSPVGMRVPRDAGLAGLLVAEQRPLLRGATPGLLLVDEVFPGAAWRVLYGVPLVDLGEVVGVAMMASRLGDSFGDRDKKALAALAHRATSIIVRQRVDIMLRVSEERLRTIHGYVPKGALESERRRRKRERFLVEASKLLGASLDCKTILASLGQLVVPTLADWCVVDMLDGANTGVVVHRDPEKQVRAHAMRQLFPPDPDGPEGGPRVLRTGGSYFEPNLTDDHLRLFTRSGEHLELMRALEPRSLIIVPLSARGRTFGALSLIQVEDTPRFDREDLLCAEELARRAGMAVDNARSYLEAQQAIEARDHILAMVTHDLRNPLAAISLNAEALRQSSEAGLPPRRLQQRAQRILRAAERMSALIEDLLDTAGIQAGHLAMRPTLHRPASLLEEVVETWEPLFSARGQALTSKVASGLADVWCDHNRIMQVFNNLIDNAAKVTPAGGTLALAAERRGGYVLFTVRDPGPGIPADELGHIFERYWRGKQAGYKGTGLGLAISQGIVEAHGGEIWAESRVGVGTTFCFTLPSGEAGALAAGAAG